MSFEKKPITELVDFNPKRAVKKGSVAPFIDMAALPVSSRDVDEITEKEFKSGGAKFCNGDTLFARITPCLENGKTAKVSGLDKNQNGFGSTEFIVMSAKDREHDEDYIYYLARLPEFRAYAKARMEGTSGRQRVPWQSLAEFEYPLPSKEQRKLAGNFFRAIDDKISLNTQTNQTLEEMAQAIFKSWFVDFDPVKAKMNGEQPQGMDETTASLFPDKLVETELGELPEGWRLIPVGQLLSQTIGGDWGNDAPDEKHTEEVRIIRGTDIPKLHGGAIESVPVRFVEAKKLKTRKLERGDIVIEVSGGSKDQPTGRSLFISDNILKRLELPTEPASFCRRFQPVSYEIGLLLAIHFQLMYNAGKTWEYQNQSTGISNFQTTYFLEAEHVVVPSEEVLAAFVKQVSPMVDMIHSNQNIELAKLRDTLLPKLLSGEIELASTDEMVAKS